MNGKYAVGIDGSVLVWENGKFESEDKDLLKVIQIAENKARKNPYFQISLDGSILYGGEWIRPSENWSTSFGFLQDMFGGDLEFITGDRPTWEKLGSNTPEGAAT